MSEEKVIGNRTQRVLLGEVLIAMLENDGDEESVAAAEILRNQCNDLIREIRGESVDKENGNSGDAVIRLKPLSMKSKRLGTNG